MKKFKLFGYNGLINKKKGRLPKTMTKNNKPKQDKTLSRIKELE
ncbi:hypothetical protein [Mycoplasmopsis bovirhinis]|nr:hypothetical protein [Mycoplasmopsis bovirhinis]